MNDYHEAAMAQAIQLARQGLYTTDPNPRVGCVITRQGEVVGVGAHLRAGEAHAEVHALRQAGEKAAGAEVYITLEPCSHYGRTPPCANALIDAGVRRVHIAMLDPNPRVSGQGVAGLRAAGIDVQVGMMAQSALDLNPGFVKRMTAHRPWVRIKLAASLDGRTAMASGESVWITGAAARRDVQFWRARASAILTGSGTVLQDNPSLNVRLSSAELGIDSAVRQPVRVVLDTQAQIPGKARVYQLQGQVLLYTKQLNSNELPENVEVISDLSDGNSIQLPQMLEDLAKREINELHVEAGHTLCGALLSQGLVDEILLYCAPHLMGNAGKALFDLPRIQSMSERIPLKLTQVRQIGDDLRLTLRTGA